MVYTISLKVIRINRVIMQQVMQIYHIYHSLFGAYLNTSCIVKDGFSKGFRIKVTVAEYHGLSNLLIVVILIVTKFIVDLILFTFFRRMLMVHMAIFVSAIIY